MKVSCPQCGADTFGPYGPFELDDKESGHSATLFSFECDTLTCITEYYIPASSRDEALALWLARKVQ